MKNKDKHLSYYDYESEEYEHMYSGLDKLDDVPLSYHFKRFIGAVLLGAVLFVVVIYLTTL